jgi:hypothetical protein
MAHQIIKGRREPKQSASAPGWRAPLDSPRCPMLGAYWRYRVGVVEYIADYVAVR